MNAAILKRGDKIQVMHRRRFEKDVRRHFVGEVEAYEHGLARASGYVFVIDDLTFECCNCVMSWPATCPIFACITTIVCRR